MVFTVRYKLSHFTFLFFQTVLRVFLPFFDNKKNFLLLANFLHGTHYLGRLSPAALLGVRKSPLRQSSPILTFNLQDFLRS